MHPFNCMVKHGLQLTLLSNKLEENGISSP
jgi:hypothetical protein